MAILSLPNELLLAILGHVEVGSVQDIKNCRLTCRRLRDVGSELLVRVIDVECSAASLSRLEAIASHPAISRGAHTVRIWLQQYIKPRNDQHLVVRSGDIDTASFIKWNQGRIIDTLREQRKYSAVSQVKRIMDLWDVFYSAVRDDNGEDEEPETRLHLKLIEQTQQQYMRLFANQAALLEGSDGEGQFVSRLAAVIASLPSIRSLTFDDKPSPRQQKNPMCERLPTISPYECDVSDLNTILYEDILTPGHGLQDVVSGWVVPQLLGELVEARRLLGCHHQRRPLEALYISLDHVEDLFPTPSPAFADSIASELSQLKVFCASFRAKRLGPGRIRDYSNMPNIDPDANFQAWQPENVNNPLNQRLKLAIASRRLERCTVACLNVDDSFDWKHHPYIGTALTSRNIPFTHLRHLQLTAVRFHQAELVAFLETCFVSPLWKDGRPEKNGDYYTARVELAQVYLCSGTWQETLQALRRASQRTGPRAFFSVDDPQGADTHEQSRIHRRRFFGSWSEFSTPWWKFLNPDLALDMYHDYWIRHAVFRHFETPWRPLSRAYDPLTHRKMELAGFCQVPPRRLPAEHVGGDVDCWGWPNPCMMIPQEEEQEQQYKSTLFKKLLVAWPPLRFLNRQRSRESVLQARLGSTDEY